MSIIKPSYALNNTIPATDFPLRIGATPALWLDGADSSTLISDGAASFTAASSQYLTVARNSSLYLNTPWFLSIWMKPGTPVTGFTYAFGDTFAGGGTVHSMEFIQHSGMTNVSLRIGDGTTQTQITLPVGSTWTANIWHHCMFWYDGTTLNWRINNNQIRTVNAPTSITTSGSSWSFGRAGSFNNQYWNGTLDSICFGKPTSQWILNNIGSLTTYLYNSGNGRRSSDFKASSYYLNGNPSGAVSWWDLDERSGTRNDRIGTNHLTDNNSVGYAAGVASGAVQFDGDPITSWQDKSGNSRHATAPADNRRPTYRTAQKNNLSVISFDGVDDALVTPSFAHFPSKRGSIITVSKLPATQGAIVATYNTGIRPGYVLYSMQTSNLTKYYDDSVNQAMSGADATDTIHSVVRSADASIDIFRNGTLGTLSGFTNNQPANNTLTIGASSALANFFGSNMYEIIIYHQALTTSQRLQIERYLGNKWGITVL